MLTYCFYIFGKRRYSTLQCFKKYDSTVKIGEVMSHYVWKGSKSKTGENRLERFALCMGLDIPEMSDCVKIHILLCIHSVGCWKC